MADKTPAEWDALKLKFEGWLSYVRFGSYTFSVTCHAEIIYLQANWTQPCSFTGKVEPQASRQWILHPEMTKSEVVQTAFKCCLTTLEHEARELFTYRGERIFGPHFHVDALADICDSKHLDYRKQA